MDAESKAALERAEQAAYRIMCFAAETPLLTPAGSKRIDQFRPGDLVLSRSEFDPEGPLAAKMVEEVFRRELGRLLEVEVGGRVIRTTAEHPFWVRSKGWVAAGELRAGDALSSHDGQWTAVAAVRDTGVMETVYNLRIADYHTYFVGGAEWSFSVWAHNADCSITVENGQHVLWDRATRKVLHQGSEAEVKALASDAGHTIIETSEARVQRAFRTMSEKEVLKVEAAKGLATRPQGSSELGITLISEYLGDLSTRKGNAKKYAVGLEFEVMPGTFERLIEMSAAHPSVHAKGTFTHLPVFKPGMNAPQVKLERGGVVSILLGSSEEAIKIFNDSIVSMGRLKNV